MTQEMEEDLVSELDAASTELARLQNVIRTGGAMYRMERATMGIPGGHDPNQTAEMEAFQRGEAQGFHDGAWEAGLEILRLQTECERLRTECGAWKDLCESGPDRVARSFAILAGFYRDDERRDIAAWLQHQADLFSKQEDYQAAADYQDAAMQVAKGAKMIGPGAAALSAKAARSGCVEGAGGTGGVISEAALAAADLHQAMDRNADAFLKAVTTESVLSCRHCKCTTYGAQRRCCAAVIEEDRIRRATSVLPEKP